MHAITRHVLTSPLALLGMSLAAGSLVAGLLSLAFG